MHVRKHCKPFKLKEFAKQAQDLYIEVNNAVMRYLSSILIMSPPFMQCFLKGVEKMHEFFEICRCFKIVGILSQRQERYKFTYVTLTNCIFARFARAVFIFDNFAAVLFQSIFTPVFQPMRSESKTKTNRRLYAQFLPRFEQVTGDSYEF